jgi:phosphoribosylformylglycinamidine synthase
MKAAVVTFPGSNCDYDCLKSVEQVGAEGVFVWHRETDLGDVDLVVLPGGFSYGDYLRPGAIARFSPIMDAVVDFARKGGPVAGICNGFQILCEVGLLPGALLRNESLKFQSHDCWLRVENPDTMFTRQYARAQVLRMPLAHADGNYHADMETLARLEGENQIVFRYVTRDGSLGEGSNPNGSAHNIAGIVNAEGNVLGMMPHPDRAMEEILGSTDGVGLFASMVDHLAGAAS